MARTHPLCDLRLGESKGQSVLDDEPGDLLVWRQPRLLLAVRRAPPSATTARLGDRSSSRRVWTRHAELTLSKMIRRFRPGDTYLVGIPLMRPRVALA